MIYLTQCHPHGVTSKKQALEAISRSISEADDQVIYQDVLFALQKRERLGSTTIGHGIAIPHARIANLQQPLCILLTLEQPIRFSNDANENVDLIFGLVVPDEENEEHLTILANISSKLHDVKFRNQLREATSNQTLHEAVSNTLNHL